MPQENPTQPLDMPVEPTMPETIAHYQVLSQLGKGGMGTVYKVRNHEGQLFALKIMHPCGSVAADNWQRFLREIELLKSLDHPNIMKIYAVGQWQDRPYFVMDYLEGMTLSQYLQEQEKLPEKEALQIAWKIALALSAVHEQGILHRDVKPSNIFLAGKKPYLMDFGVSCYWQEGEGRLTRTGIIIGTPNYMPIEQSQGNAKKMGPWSDVYALGATLYHLLSGVVPFKGKSDIEVLVNSQTKELRPLRKLASWISKDTEAVVHKAMEKEYRQRYQSAEEFANDLRALLHDKKVAIVKSTKTSTGRSGKTAQTSRTTKKSSPTYVWIYFVLLNLVIVAPMIWWKYFSAHSQPTKSVGLYKSTGLHKEPNVVPTTKKTIPQPAVSQKPLKIPVTNTSKPEAETGQKEEPIKQPATNNASTHENHQVQQPLRPVAKTPIPLQFPSDQELLIWPIAQAGEIQKLAAMLVEEKKKSGQPSSAKSQELSLKLADLYATVPNHYDELTHLQVILSKPPALLARLVKICHQLKLPSHAAYYLQLLEKKYPQDPVYLHNQGFWEVTKQQLVFPASLAGERQHVRKLMRVLCFARLAILEEEWAAAYQCLADTAYAQDGQAIELLPLITSVRLILSLSQKNLPQAARDKAELVALMQKLNTVFLQRPPSYLSSTIANNKLKIMWPWPEVIYAEGLLAFFQKNTPEATAKFGIIKKQYAAFGSPDGTEEKGLGGLCQPYAQSLEESVPIKNFVEQDVARQLPKLLDIFYLRATMVLEELSGQMPQTMDTIEDMVIMELPWIRLFYYKNGAAFHTQQAWQMGIDYLTQSRKLAPNFDDPIFYLALIAFDTGNRQEAKKYIQYCQGHPPRWVPWAAGVIPQISKQLGQD